MQCTLGLFSFSPFGFVDGSNTFFVLATSFNALAMPLHPNYELMYQWVELEPGPEWVPSNHILPPDLNVTSDTVKNKIHSRSLELRGKVFTLIIYDVFHSEARTLSSSASGKVEMKGMLQP